MKRFSAPPAVYADPTRPPDDDDSDASSLSDGSKKVKTAQSFESLFNSESLSDIILDINRGEYVFHAHKMIVGLKSERLAALITNVASVAVPMDNSGKPVLYLQEPTECSAVFSRFLYFIYSGAVWLHRDYVVPLFKLSIKYGVGALVAHCENYIVQILNKMLNQDPASPLTQALPIGSVCDLFEDPGYKEETKKVAFHVLCRRFSDLARTERWIAFSWHVVRDLLHSDECTCEENLILVSATDWMKRNKLQDKARIQEILSSIRYPRLPRRVLYHLHATSSFKKFPPVQDLIDAAIRYHCFKDVPEAQAEFTGLQYRARGCSSGSGRNNNRHTMCGGENNAMSTSDTTTSRVEDNNNTLEPNSEDNQTHHASPGEIQINAATLSQFSNEVSGYCHQHETTGLLNNITFTTDSTLPVHNRSRSEDRRGNASPQRDHRLAGSRHATRRHGTVFDTSVSSFHSPCSPVAAVQPRVQGQRNSIHIDGDSIEDSIALLANSNNNNNINDNDINVISHSQRKP